MALWLRSEGLSQVSLSAERHYGQRWPDLAYVLAEHPDQSVRRAARAKAALALAALGHRLAPRPGADVWDLQPLREVDLSHHERLTLVGRVRAAVRAAEAPDRDVGQGSAGGIGDGTVEKRSVELAEAFVPAGVTMSITSEEVHQIGGSTDAADAGSEGGHK